jgi:sugar-specific transcriptional regulator TrmB
VSPKNRKLIQELRNEKNEKRKYIMVLKKLNKPYNGKKNKYNNIKKNWQVIENVIQNLSGCNYSIKDIINKNRDGLLNNLKEGINNAIYGKYKIKDGLKLKYEYDEDKHNIDLIITDNKKQ